MGHYIPSMGQEGAVGLIEEIEMRLPFQSGGRDSNGHGKPERQDACKPMRVQPLPGSKW